MNATGERFIPQDMDGQISVEHFSRYLFANNYIDLRGKTVLDIASGTGYGSSIMAQTAKQVTGVDISQEAVDYANTHYANDKLTFLKGDCCNIPISDNSIDVIVSFETIEHIDRHEEFLSEIKRVLTPDGVVIISSPNKRLYSDVPQRVNPYHLKELYNEEFQSLLSRHFSHTLYLGQSYQLSSVIYPISNLSQPLRRPTEYRDNNILDKEPLYNIIIASNASLTTLKPLPAAFFYEDTVTIDFLQNKAFEEGRLSCKKTMPWKLGHYLISPFRFIKRLLHK